MLDLLDRIAAWDARRHARQHERLARQQERLARNPVYQWLLRSGERVAAQRAELERRRAEVLASRGRPVVDPAVRRARRQGYRFCVMCKQNVRPQPPPHPARLLTLGLLTPGKWECPRCRGVRFRDPVPW